MDRNTSGLRGILFDELFELRNGTADPKRSLAVAKISQQILATAKVEMELHALMVRARAAGETLELGGVELGEHVYLAAPPESETEANASEQDQES